VVVPSTHKLVRFGSQLNASRVESLKAKNFRFEVPSVQYIDQRLEGSSAPQWKLFVGKDSVGYRRDPYRKRDAHHVPNGGG
jgi:hypothetical protein